MEAVRNRERSDPEGDLPAFGYDGTLDFSEALAASGGLEMGLFFR